MSYLYKTAQEDEWTTNEKIGAGAGGVAGLTGMGYGASAIAGRMEASARDAVVNSGLKGDKEALKKSTKKLKAIMAVKENSPHVLASKMVQKAKDGGSYVYEKAKDGGSYIASKLGKKGK